MFLFTFLTSLGNLQRIDYNAENMEYYSHFQRFVNVYIINFLWIIEGFVLLVLIVNFLICVIFNTYELVKPQKKYMILQQHAELSKECFQFLREFRVLFKKAKDYHFKVFTFTMCKDQNGLEVD